MAELNEWMTDADEPREVKVTPLNELVRANRNAPADRLIKALFRLGAADVSEEEGALGDADEALMLWHSLDEMRLRFTLNGRRASVLLIHQGRRGHIEDIADYSAWLSDVPELAAILNED